MGGGTREFESAWSTLKRDPDTVDKALPLIPLAFGAMGAATGAGLRLRNPETGRFDPGLHGGATFQDPLTAGLLAEKEIEDATAEQRALGALVGATQAVNPVGAIGRGARGLRGLSRAARARRGAASARQASNAARASGEATEAMVRNTMGRGNMARTRGVMAQEAALYPGVRSTVVAPGVIQSTERAIPTFSQMARGAAGGVRNAPGQALRGAAGGVARVAGSRPARFAGRAAQLAGLAEEQEVPELVAGGVGAFLANRLSQLGQGQGQGGQYGQSGLASAGFGGAGVQGVQNVQGNLTSRRQIFDPYAYRKFRTAT